MIEFELLNAFNDIKIFVLHENEEPNEGYPQTSNVDIIKGDETININLENSLIEIIYSLQLIAQVIPDNEKIVINPLIHNLIKREKEIKEFFMYYIDKFENLAQKAIHQNDEYGKTIDKILNK
jgi:hypothetical protein